MFRKDCLIIPFLCVDNIFHTYMDGIVLCISQECDEYVLNDNTAGDIKILRSCLEAMSLQNSASSRDDDVSHRRSKRIRHSSSVAVFTADV